MKTWTIPVYWTTMGKINVVADTLEEAIELAKDPENEISLPDNGVYLEDSWEPETDIDVVRECYNHGQED